ncbi:MAG TPA: DUF4965 domain-containing protein [Bacillota bacterium]
MPSQLRPPAVPLITVDPYFSVWSFANRLYDDFTRHWTGAKNSLTGFVWIDDQPYRFAGRMDPSQDPEDQEPPEMLQTGLSIKPLSSIYMFEAGGITLQVDFTTPLLPGNLDILSRPVSYVSFTAHSNDRRPHHLKLYFDVSAEWCVNNPNQKVVGGRKKLGAGISTMYIGTEEQAVLSRSGDDLRIDWGFINLATNDCFQTETVIAANRIRQDFIRHGELHTKDLAAGPSVIGSDNPVMACAIDLDEVNGMPVSTFVTLAYDDIDSIGYFGKHLPAYWRRNGLSFSEMLESAISEYPEIMRQCAEFNQRLKNDAIQAGGSKYADILSLAYRQAIAAHKLVADSEGQVLFISKECFSNGCMATVDVSFPSIPLFLLYNSELVKGMMRPIFKYAASPEWTFDFAPHDIGQYPLANGQVYGKEKNEILLRYQMPIEECGNLLIMMSAVCSMEGSAAFAGENWDLLLKWAHYLKEHGLDPENQLCTDDFAGHLAHNANLSIKAIVALAGFAKLCRMLGKNETAAEFLKTAQEMAGQWEKKAQEGDHYKLTFDQPHTWSLKYNLLWDELLGLGIFAPEIHRKELDYYLQKQNRYGTPLDNRSTYTKADWLVWAAALADTKETFERLVEPLWLFLDETPSRVPFTDWYDTVSGRQIGFQHRSVVGGLFAKLLKDRIKGRSIHSF